MMSKDAAVAMGRRSDNTKTIRDCVFKVDGRDSAYGYAWRKAEGSDDVDDADDDDDDDDDDELDGVDSRSASGGVVKVVHGQDATGGSVTSSKPMKLALQNKPALVRPAQPLSREALSLEVGVVVVVVFWVVLCP